MDNRIEEVKKIACKLCAENNGSSCITPTPDPNHWICKSWLNKANQLFKPKPELENNLLLTEIAELFKIAREEGAIRKWADGRDDAEEVISKVLKAYEGYVKKVELCGNCDTPLLREGEIYQKLEEAKRREGERILNYLKGLLESTPKASLAATIDLIEALKSEGGEVKNAVRKKN